MKLKLDPQTGQLLVSPNIIIRTCIFFLAHTGHAKNLAIYLQRNLII
ncbi:MAG: hypothetical protein OEL77_03215 [Nitrosopumilus sp.]|nr:hypothetical protein [Nitrosopumilus sp.]MDH3385006.1 hypothetical protein [Nitrosopumilus sp.]